ncbi:cysteine-rich venom protein 1-like isoform X3 [Hylaeus anthracinus]|uniref:cysteine-rich venom protein 1-like isoform X3 n=1 Tax=Hylaeus anthracinus TaxID=313031 RepID=UPI0023BA30C7|nr:cysteine-rich venom protein 1-like isoform X3 [Hylaeus anthracinus]
MVLAGNQRCLVLIKPETSVDEFASRVARYLLCPLLALPALLNTSSSETKVDSTRTELNARGIEESTMSPYIVAIVLLTAMVLAAAEEEHCCPKNQTWSQCGPVCESTCKDPRVKMCKLRPCTDSTAGCTCENGYVRDEDSFTCLKYEDCVTA